MRQSVFHASLNRPKLVMGVGDKAFGVESAVFALALNFQVLILLPLPFLLHLFFRWLTKKDPIALEAYMKYMREADLYDPWVRPSTTESRSLGYGRGIHA